MTFSRERTSDLSAMPIRIYLSAGVLRLDFVGICTGQELVGALGEIERIEATLPRVPDRIADLSGPHDSDIRFPDFLNVTTRRHQRLFANAFRTAIVAATPVSYGMARSFQTLNDHPQITIRIFPDLASAEAWLAEPAPDHS